MAMKILNIDERIAKREKVIPKNIQEEVLKILNTNAISYGFYVSTWSERRVIKLLKEHYRIKITRYMAKLLLKDAKDRKHFVEDAKREYNEIMDLKNSGYNVVNLYFLKIGKIDKELVDHLVFQSFYEKELDVNLGICIGANNVYIEIIFSDSNIVSKRGKFLFMKKNADSTKREIIEIKKRNVIDNKASFIRKIIKRENLSDKIVFVCIDDLYIDRFNKSDGNTFFYVIEEKKANILLNKFVVKEEDKRLEDIRDDNKFKSIREINDFINENIMVDNKEILKLQ